CECEVEASVKAAPLTACFPALTLPPLPLNPAACTRVFYNAGGGCGGGCGSRVKVDAGDGAVFRTLYCQFLFRPGTESTPQQRGI
ncbi:MAG: hypothetical protein MIO93_03890, partial [ANME-2 cluster archaeon]|nr:hypothetical protein [ANME-2 cluster archaeon]